MKTTFRTIKKFNPCADGWEKLCNNINPNMDMDKEITILQILNSNGVEHAFWALRTQSYKNYCLILADMAESVLHFFEEKHPDDKRPREAINAIRLWHACKISKEDLNTYAYNAYNAYIAAAAYADAAAYAAYAADAAADAADAAAVEKEQWQKNEEILRRYLEKEESK